VRESEKKRGDKHSVRIQKNVLSLVSSQKQMEVCSVFDCDQAQQRERKNAEESAYFSKRFVTFSPQPFCSDLGKSI
jgi:hypothetical protein